MTLNAADAPRRFDRFRAQSDAELLALFRGGDKESYGVLWERHRAVALRAGRALMRDGDGAEDLVQDAFHQVASAIIAGSGPTEFFRAYLFTTMRNRASRLRRRAAREVVVDDVGDVPTEDADTVVADSERPLAVAAFQRLPERLRLVLWNVDVEQQPLARVADTLGTTPNNVARLVGRARLRLRTLFVQAQVEQWNGSPHPGCARFRSKLGAHFTGELPATLASAVDAHLAACRRCSTISEMLVDVASPLRRAAVQSARPADR